MGNPSSKPSYLEESQDNLATAEDSNDSLIRHETQEDNTFAYERTDNQYYWEFVYPASPTIIEQPLPAPSGLLGASATHVTNTPITIYNNWPKKLSNASIFPFLLPPSEPMAKYADFFDFVKVWYQSACAILYVSPNSTHKKIIGSGCLVNNTNTVATARHNFNNIPINQLHVRFFNYAVEVTNFSNILLIRERYLDIPVIQKSEATSGLDAGHLTIPTLRNTNIFNRYARILSLNTLDTNLAPGHYAMFHFAEAKPQVSIGEVVESRMEAPLHEQIIIQAGPGASGATIIWKGFQDVSGQGISIYRVIENGWFERRIIPFSKFNPSHIGSVDNIEAPYYFYPNFSLISSHALQESGYEFLCWSVASRVYGTERPPRPGNDAFNGAYRVNPDHANHHIVPILDLLYLWDYLHTVDVHTHQVIIETLNQEVTYLRKKNEYDLIEEIETYYPTEREQRWHDGMNRIRQEIEQYSANRYKILYRQALLEKYSTFYPVLGKLFPGEIDYNENNKEALRTLFVWSWWNLFKGWDGHYRQDDPANDHVDRSEKRKPANFSPIIWNCLKGPQYGLHRQIQNLKRTKSPYEAKETESNILNCLKILRREWSKRREEGKAIIHPYNENEWERVPGKKDGHRLYRIK